MNNEDIKNYLENKLKKIPAAPFLFIGSGITRRYLGAPSFKELLEIFSKKILRDEMAFTIYYNKVKAANEDIKEENIYPLIAENIEKDFRKNFAKIKVDKAFQENKNLLKKGISPFKIQVAEYFKSLEYESKNLTEDLKVELNLLKASSEKNISGIITTNYDLLLENIFSDFKVYIGQEDLLFSHIQEIGEIYKIHGSCKNPESIIITARDYEKFNEKNAYLAAKLLTIFIEYPVIFMGYSVNDPNIRKILKSISNCLVDENKRKRLKENLFFIEWVESENNDISSFYINFENENIEMTKIKTNSFIPIYNAILSNKRKFSIRVLRQIKEQLYELVLNSDPKEKIRVVNINEINTTENIEYVIGIGVTKLAEKGYNSITLEDIYKDIIYDDRNFDINSIVTLTLPLLLSRHSNSVPIYKYISKYNGILPEKIKEVSDIWTKDEKSRRKDYENITLEKLKEKYKDNDKRIVKEISYLNPDNINLEELLEYIKSLMIKYPEILKNKKKRSLKAIENKNYPESSPFRKIIKIYDYLKYKKK
ncbi:SIR2 family protein [Marinitoga lauensis]|uniref:SIR2 family protein n=1 Tax=Marinitoga lauensis TaxID=2201189 RepID=UPI00101253CD|nr:SIR2 family protein [Marinitoga lauensis]